MAATKNKRKKAAVAAVAAAAILLAGTFAWTSISQIALNESAGIVNVGGRLHDDFNGENKDVYVENFTDPLDGGVPIYARVRLDEYMEVGQDAGGYGEDVDGDGTVEAEPVVAGTDVTDEDTWTTHIPENVCTVCATGETCKIHTHWTWEMGGQTTYMPTFNKDKDSLKSEINGTYEGLTKGDTVHYDDYIAYTEGQTLDGSASYDDDTNTVDDGNVWTQEETHTAKQTAAGTVIMMADWDGTAGDYWVYDTDGWAYWANPIMPGEATGLFLSSIDMKKNPGEKCYYGINVVGQFATVGDWEYFEEGGEPTPAALEVLAAASANVPTVTVTTENNRTSVLAGDQLQFSATESKQQGRSASTVEWVVLDGEGNEVTTSTISETGLLTVGEDEPEGMVLVVAAKSRTNPGAVGLKSITVRNLDLTVSVSADNSEKQYEPGTATEIDFSANVEGDDAREGTIVWKATDENGNALTASSISNKGVLSVGADETAKQIKVYAVVDLGGGVEIVSDVYIVSSTAVELATTSDQSVPEYAALTSDGSGGYALTFVRSNDAVDEGISTINGGDTVINAFEGIEDINALQDGYSSALPWHSVRSEITSISFEGSNLKPINTAYFFYGFDNLNFADLHGLDTSEVKDLTNMFGQCGNLEEVIIPDGFCSNANEFHYMFSSCPALEKVTFEGTFGGEQTTSIGAMFYNCDALEFVDLSGLKTNTTDGVALSSLFWGCTSLKTVVLPDNLKLAARPMNLTFHACTSLETVEGLDTMDVSQVTEFVATFDRCGKLNADLSSWNPSVDKDDSTVSGAPNIILPAAWQ